NIVAGIWLFSLLGFVIAFGIQLNRDTSIPTINTEESTYSREFWMFIGALVFFLSAVLIISQTSLPVFNKVFDKKLAGSEDAEFSYNRIQVFIAIIIGTLTAIIQYLKYKNTNRQFFLKRIMLPTIIALAISILISVFGNISYDKKGFGFLGAIHVAIFAAVYSVVANASYIWLGFKGKLKRAGSAIAHVGFGLVLLGILISSSKKEILSWNTTGISTLPDTDASNKIVGKPAENTTLFRGISTDMGKYDVTYTRDTLNDVNHKKYFEVHFKSKVGNEDFNVYPDVMHNTKGQDGFAPNPSSKHYWNRDIFVYVTSWLEGNRQDTSTFRTIKLKQGDTSFFSNGIIIFKKVEVNKPDAKGVLPGETSMSLDLQVIGKNGSRYGVFPGVAIQNDSAMRSLPDTVVAQNLIVRFNRIADAKNGVFEIGIKESNQLTDLLTLKVLQFPFINLLWLGVMVMVIGTLMSVAKYVGKKQNSDVEENKARVGRIKINKVGSRI
ncbi:MAG: cytochrome c assembly protein, partial [Bacteroidota bacterium]|nr:cytochrome c assembly protein [Bacteroidota bacterium]